MPGRKGKSRRTLKRKTGVDTRRSWIAALIVCFGIALAATLLLFGVRRWEHRAYPLEYADEILSASAKYELPPALIASVINTESGFRSEAKSHAGAVGLMQIMPETAEWIAWRQGREHYEEKLTGVGYNIDMGCYLLSFLLERYSGNVEYALAAYNAGFNAVDSWLEDENCITQEGNLNIPYAETKNYVRKVMVGIERYSELYKQLCT